MSQKGDQHHPDTIWFADIQRVSYLTHVSPSFRWSTQLHLTPHLMERKRTRTTRRTGSTLVRSPHPASRSSFRPKTAKKSFSCKFQLISWTFFSRWYKTIIWTSPSDWSETFFLMLLKHWMDHERFLFSRQCQQSGQRQVMKFRSFCSDKSRQLKLSFYTESLFRPSDVSWHELTDHFHQTENGLRIIFL